MRLIVRRSKGMIRQFENIKHKLTEIRRAIEHLSIMSCEIEKELLELERDNMMQQIIIEKLSKDEICPYGTDASLEFRIKRLTEKEADFRPVANDDSIMLVQTRFDDFSKAVDRLNKKG